MNQLSPPKSLLHHYRLTNHRTMFRGISYIFMNHIYIRLPKFWCNHTNKSNQIQYPTAVKNHFHLHLHLLDAACHLFNRYICALYLSEYMFFINLFDPFVTFDPTLWKRLYSLNQKWIYNPFFYECKHFLYSFESKYLVK